MSKVKGDALGVSSCCPKRNAGRVKRKHKTGEANQGRDTSVRKGQSDQRVQIRVRDRAVGREAGESGYRGVAFEVVAETSRAKLIRMGRTAWDLWNHKAARAGNLRLLRDSL